MSDAKFYSELKQLLSFTQDISPDATSEEVIRCIVDTVNEDYKTPFIQNAVKILSYGNPDKLTYIKRVFDVACYLVTYLHDPAGHEIVFTSKLLIRNGKGDCKKFSTFIGAMLKAKGIEPIEKVVSYDGHDWQHIYVITIVDDNGKYITLDPVNDCQYNKEVRSVSSQLYFLNGKHSAVMGNKLTKMGSVANNPMGRLGIACDNMLGDLDKLTRKQVQAQYFQIGCIFGSNDEQMMGLGDAEYEKYYEKTEGIEGIGKRSKARKQKQAAKRAGRKQHRAENKAARKEKRKRIFKKGKKFAFAASRAAFLGLLKLGPFLAKTPLKINLTNKLLLAWQKDNGASLKKIWVDLGGNPTALQTAILKGAKEKISGEDYSQIQAFDNLNVDDNRQMGSIGSVAAVAAAITASAPILIIVMKHLHTVGVISDADANNADKVVAAAEDLHDENGHHDQELDTNAVVKSGREEKDNGSANAAAFKQEDQHPTDIVSSDGSKPEPQRTPDSKDSSMQDNSEEPQAGSRTAASKLTNSAEEATATPKSTIDFYQPLAINTWFRAVFLLGLMSAFNPHLIVFKIAATISLGVLIGITTYKSISLIKSKKQIWTKQN